LKIAIVGSRGYPNLDEVHNYVVNNFEHGDVLVSGGARGVDAAAERTAQELHLETLIFLPDWNTYGKSAGFIRNQDIIKNADRVVAFWDGKSRGTQHSMNLAKQYNKPLEVIQPK
jgi:hypothetical protein